MWTLRGRSAANTAALVAIVAAVLGLVVGLVAAAVGLLFLAAAGLAVLFVGAGVLLGVGFVPDHGPHRRFIGARARAAIDAAWRNGDRAAVLTAAASQLRQAADEVEEVVASTAGDSVLRRSLLTAAIKHADTALTVVGNARDELATGRGGRGSP